MTWYPLSWLFSLIPDSFNAFVLSAYVLASLFTYGYVHTLTGSRLAALVAGTTYGMSGFFMAHLTHTNMIHAAAWMPLVIWALEKLRVRPYGGWLVALAIGVAFSALAGHTQIFVYTLILAAAYALFRGWRAPRWWRYYAVSLAGAVLGIWLAAVMLLPALELTQESVRPRLSYSEFVTGSLPWNHLLLLFFPYLFGGTQQHFYDALYFGRWSLAELTGYVGLIPLVLAGLGMALFRKASLTWFWAAVAMASLLLALGDSTPLPRLLIHLPLYNLFRGPPRHLFEFSLAISVLAGFGTVAVMRLTQNERLKAVRLASIVMAGVMGLVGLTIVFHLAPTLRQEALEAGISDLSVRPWLNPAIGIPPLMFLGGIVILWWWSKHPAAAWRSALLIAILVVDLGSFGWFHDWRWRAPAEADVHRPDTLEAYHAELAVSGQRLIPFYGWIQPLHLGAPNLTRLWDIPSASGYNPLILKRYSQLLSMDSKGLFPAATLGHEYRALDLLAVRYLFLPTTPGLGEDPAFVTNMLAADPTRWRHLQDLPLGTVYENLRAMPRAWLVPEVMSLRSDEILIAIQQSRLPDGRTYDPSMVALVEEPFTFKAENRASHHSAQVIRLSDTSIEVHVDAETAAFLVLSDVYYPGWQATIDGEPTHVLRTNYVLRGVMVSPGVHVVRFEFRPTRFYAGAGISAFAVLAVIGVLAWPLVGKSKSFVSGE